MSRSINAVLLLCVGTLFASPAKAQSTVQPEGLGALVVNKALYELNFDVDPSSEAITAQTKAAIAQWQRNRGVASTGVLTVEEFEGLKHIDTSKWIWGSVAATLDGQSWAAWNAHSRAQSEADVSAKCRGFTGNPRACTIGSAFSRQEDQEGWVVYALCSRHVAAEKRTLYSLTVDGGHNRANTIDGAMDYLTSKGYSRGQCSVKTLVEVRRGPQK